MKMNWNTLHHLYIGCLIGFGGIGWLAVALPTRSLEGIVYALAVVLGGFGYALDDAFQHAYNWNTPFHRLDVLLKKLPVYQTICGWLDKTFFKKEK